MGGGGSPIHEMLGPLQMALGASAMASGQPQIGVPLLATGIGTTGAPPQQGAPQDPMGSAMGVLGNQPLAMGLGAMMQPHQQPQMPQPPPRPMPPPQQQMGGGMPSQQPVPPPQLAMPGQQGAMPPQAGGAGASAPIPPQLQAMLRQLHPGMMG